MKFALKSAQLLLLQDMSEVKQTFTLPSLPLEPARVHFSMIKINIVASGSLLHHLFNTDLSYWKQVMYPILSHYSSLFTLSFTHWVFL